MGNFPKFRPKNSNLLILTENWLTWYLGGADSESRLRFLKFRPQSSFLGKFGPKNGKRQSCLFCLKIGTHSISMMLILILTLVFWISNPKTHFWANLGQKRQSCPFCFKIGADGIFWMLILIPTLVFRIPKPIFVFGQI